MENGVYITAIGHCLPNAPVDNDAMESVLGQVGERPSRARRIVLRNNGIERRHYAIDPHSGAVTHTNAEMTAEAVRALAGRDFRLEQIDLLVCGTSTPDQLMPNHAAMVHGQLAHGPCEVVATSGICLAGVTALKHAWLAIRAGEHQAAVATGSELASTYLRANFLQRTEESRSAAALEAQPELAFEADFLRWMLSDGAGAFLLRRQPAPQGLSLRVDWIECCSYADTLGPCMYAGANKLADGTLKGWRDYPDPYQMVDANTLAVKQDVRLLNEHIVRYTLGHGLRRALAKHPLRAEEIDWFLPHYSSAWFRDKVAEELRAIDFPIPETRWFTNLPERGNTGAASIYLMLEALFHSGKLRAGQRLLCFVPESGRFSTGFFQLTVVTS